MTDPQDEIDEILKRYHILALQNPAGGYPLKEAKAAINRLMLEAKLETAVYLEEHSGDVYDLIGKLKDRLGDK